MHYRKPFKQNYMELTTTAPPKNDGAVVEFFLYYLAASWKK